MPSPPTYRKVNPADMPIMFIALVSETLPVTTLNDFAENVAVPSLSAINGIAQVDTVPPQKYAVRIQVNPDVLARRKIGINTVSDALQAGNVNLPGGTINGPSTAYTLDSNGQLMDAKQFNSLIVTYQNGYPVRICDLGNAVDGVQNDKCAAWYLTGAEPQQTVVLRIRKQPGTNTVALAHAVREKLPKIRANTTWLVVACSAVIGSLWIDKGLGLIVGGFVPNPFEQIVEYWPTWPEALITLGIWALGFLILTVLYKIVVTVREETA